MLGDSIEAFRRFSNRHAGRQQSAGGAEGRQTAAPAGPAVQLPFQDLVDQRGVSLAARRLQRLAEEEAEEPVLAPPVLRHLVGVGGQDLAETAKPSCRERGGTS